MQGRTTIGGGNVELLRKVIFVMRAESLWTAVFAAKHFLPRNRSGVLGYDMVCKAVVPPGSVVRIALHETIAVAKVT
jgi:hypothetical protein